MTKNSDRILTVTIRVVNFSAGNYSVPPPPPLTHPPTHTTNLQEGRSHDLLQESLPDQSKHDITHLFGGNLSIRKERQIDKTIHRRYFHFHSNFPTSVQIDPTLTWRTELQKSRACINVLSSGTAFLITGRGDCHSSTTRSLVLGRPLYSPLKPVARNCGQEKIRGYPRR